MNIWFVAIVEKKVVSETDKSENWTLLRPVYTVTGWGKAHCWKQEVLNNHEILKKAQDEGKDVQIELMEFKPVSVG